MVKNLDLLDADELINNLYSKFKNDEEILKKAYLYASEGHLNQKRASGEPYITHPLQVATYLADLSMDIETVVSAILHDLIEDTDVTFKDIKKDLISIFKKNGIKPIECVNKKFDPNFHQAMSEIEDDKVEPGSIIQEIQAGYMLGERLLRPALVSVAKKKVKKDEENKEKKEQK